MPREVDSAQGAAQIRAWSDRLYDLLVEMEEANGPSVESATKLENLVRYAWDEAREAATRAEQSIPLPPPTTEVLECARESLARGSFDA